MTTFALISALSTALLQAAVAEPNDSTKRVCNTDFSVPFSVGERLTYDVYFGPLKAGEGSMEVMGHEDVRGTNTWHTRFRVRGGVPFYRVDDVLESWIGTECFHTLRFVQDFVLQPPPLLVTLQSRHCTWESKGKGCLSNHYPRKFENRRLRPTNIFL